MSLKSRLNYWQRVFASYLGKSNSQLTFWHERPAVNEAAVFDSLDQYYMTFFDKTKYLGPFDSGGIPLLDYHGQIGQQYNPIAIAQYGLGHYNLYQQNHNQQNLYIAIRQANWLVDNLEKNDQGILVWMHHFDWEYRDKLKAPWYSALAQGNGISLLVRIYLTTKEEKYLAAAQKAFASLLVSIKKGGVLDIDRHGDYWLEETIVEPPTHILNGFLWTLMGVWDYWLLTKEVSAKDLFDNCLETLRNNLSYFDAGFWSLYEQSGTKMKMLTSRFYHSLHVVQLEIMYRMTNKPIFKFYHDRWDKYQKNKLFILLSQMYKTVFKIFYY
ncbi:MAG: D-glucuronyl C5-epimerase family protein [Patescibacteria group bacterium]|nr:D-glucuronyl C5-epimerase family protein [Patescibacteria group bacterium]MDD5121300.1 D-glucuronyl C5-epimerase family protein [Patescibacteria group bacterium]MDD5221730.1 D-glucuronyl C5-epimerase family protein [Patescibacteria group bacterium]MDD5395781.1 D-glucuronyl C5-epimerase family protein [Patescibacteria group bacterium]